MTYPEAVDYIHSLQKFGICPGLDRINELLFLLGSPQKGKSFIHVAGTNGKGSVSAALSGVLTAAGYNTGLYTSPFVSDFMERIQLNGAPMEKSDFASAVGEVKPVVEKMAAASKQITEFEALTAAALLCFRRSNCDITVLEVGLGGRLDATNAIGCPRVGVITSLSLDHTAILGDTIEKIAFEKCGIIKPGSVTVSAANQPNKAKEVIAEICHERNSELIIPDMKELSVQKSDIFGTDFTYKGLPYKTVMPGLHQMLNMTAAIEAASVLKRQGINISEKAVYDGILSAKLPARVEVIKEKPLVILDGGHNPAGAKAFFEALKPELKNKRLTVLAGMMADKAVKESILPLASVADRFIAVTPENPRAMKAEELCKLVSEVASAKAIPDAKAAVAEIMPDLTENDVFCVVGSLYLAGEVRRTLLEFC